MANNAKCNNNTLVQSDREADYFVLQGPGEVDIYCLEGFLCEKLNSKMDESQFGSSESDGVVFLNHLIGYSLFF